MSVLAVAEHRQGELRDESYEIVTAGHQLADAVGGELDLVVVGGNVDEFANALKKEGVSTIYTINHGIEFQPTVYTQAVTALYDEIRPDIVLTPNSVNGLGYAPAVANRLGIPIVTDVVDFSSEAGLVLTREMYGSKVQTTVQTPTPAVVTIRGRTWEPTEADGSAERVDFDSGIDEASVRSTLLGFEETMEGDVDISSANFIVSIGRGIEDEDNLSLIEELADTLGATLAASRPIVDNGWLPRARQVGQSGKEVTPDVYIAIGISGAVQHVAGMKGADTIIAINTDPDAPIFDIADYGIVGDLFEVIPELIEAFE
ncbi:electron transfer flavoprotein subunit alpha/FixB family protein (plasmid) [Salinigranum rubrum]|uniref:Electron transfer flavoprotein subunit alpha/FixB family protein n=1 Tax=Salinigranum rubrum TaxID=755307 RepID=A0A2I8VRV6_9EURY|nr:electron transfer flavoprotein subunit alpha/FixB family protein [Salinigranum rubrum]AUV84658.1 electron transfer flavoprotein subunit alpha/FixB family protein [Salinigranum rubrum]